MVHNILHTWEVLHVRISAKEGKCFCLIGFFYILNRVQYITVQYSVVIIYKNSCLKEKSERT